MSRAFTAAQLGDLDIPWPSFGIMVRIQPEVLIMMFKLAKALTCALMFWLMACALLPAQCPVNSIRIRGRVENARGNPSVRVQLFYPPDSHKKHPTGIDTEEKPQPGESAEATLDGDAFAIPIEFLTNDRRTTMNFNPACTRKPQTVVVTLRNDGSGNNDQEYDRVTLEFPREFKSEDASHYTPRSDVVLNGQR